MKKNTTTDMMVCLSIADLASLIRPLHIDIHDNTFHGGTFHISDLDKKLSSRGEADADPLSVTALKGFIEAGLLDQDLMPDKKTVARTKSSAGTGHRHPPEYGKLLALFRKKMEPYLPPQRLQSIQDNKEICQLSKASKCNKIR